jgi:RND family efflux transporter MFP subunit
LPTVTVSYPLQREVTDYQDYTGRTAAVDSVQVQARVTGYLDNIYFTEGAEVRGDNRLRCAARVVGLLGAPAGPLLAAADLCPGQLQAGDLLYEIDPRPYQAAYDAAKAQVAQNEASLELAKQDNRRYQKLAKDQEGAVTKADLDRYQSQENQAVANLDYARANLETAKLNLDWTKITAPVTGLIGRLLVTRGNLIVANQTTLTTVVRQDPMWVYFDVDEPTVLQVHELIRQGRFGPVSAEVSASDPSRWIREAKIPVRLQLANEKGFPHEAIMDFVNNQLDQATATLLLRAIFPNPRPKTGPRVFAPNNFVRVRVRTSAPYQALLVNPEAVGTDQDLRYLYVVDEDNKVVRHAVKLGSLHDGLQVITDGLKPGERVIVSGIQRVQQGATVNPKFVPMPMPTQDSLPTTPPPVLKAPAPPPRK